MSKILAIETATEACSAALLFDDKVITRFQHAPREHTKLVLPMLDEVLEEGGVELKDVDAIAFSRGPGAFTGLRIAAGVAQGVALSVDKPVIPVSTLEALALQASDNSTNNKTIIAALDARMGEVYWGIFKYCGGGIELIGEELLSKPDEMLAAFSGESSYIAIGTGWDTYHETLFINGKPENLRLIKDVLPSAEAIARLALPLLKANKAVAPEDAQPVYIRNNVAEKSRKV